MPTKTEKPAAVSPGTKQEIAYKVVQVAEWDTLTKEKEKLDTLKVDDKCGVVDFEEEVRGTFEGALNAEGKDGWVFCGQVTMYGETLLVFTKKDGVVKTTEQIFARPTVEE